MLKSSDGGLVGRRALVKSTEINLADIMATKLKSKGQPEPIADILVSYSYPDLQTAKYFAKWIGECGLRAHMLEPGEGAGKSFPGAMNDAIGRCERLLAVFTRHYDDSKACTAEIEGMWLRDQDARLGRIIIVKLDQTPVQPLYAKRDYWDFTKVAGEDVMDEFKRRIGGLPPIVTGTPRRRQKSVPTQSVPSPVAPPKPAAALGMSANISGTRNSLKQVGGNLTEHHYHEPAKVKHVLERRGNEISNAQAAELLQRIKDWGRAMWESWSPRKKMGKTERDTHAKAQGAFKSEYSLPRYDALEATRFEDALRFIEVQIAMLRPNLMKANPAKGRQAFIGSIKQAMKQMGVTNESYYPQLASRLKLKPFASLTDVTKAKDLKRIYNMARRDART